MGLHKAYFRNFDQRGIVQRHCCFFEKTIVTMKYGLTIAQKNSSRCYTEGMLKIFILSRSLAYVNYMNTCHASMHEETDNSLAFLDIVFYGRVKLRNLQLPCREYTEGQIT